MTNVRGEMLDLISEIQNEIDNFNDDEDMSDFAEHPSVISILGQSLAIMEGVFPALKSVEDVMNGAISPTVFLQRWRASLGHLQYPDIEPKHGEGVKETDTMLKRISRKRGSR